MEKKEEKKKKALEEEMLDEVNGGGSNYIFLSLIHCQPLGKHNETRQQYGRTHWSAHIVVGVI